MMNTKARLLEDLETAAQRILNRIAEVRKAKTEDARENAEADLYADSMVMREKSKTVAKYLSSDAN